MRRQDNHPGTGERQGDVKLAGLIPQVYYDVIARIIPGFAVGVTAYLAYAGPRPALDGLLSFLSAVARSASATLVVVGLVGIASYLLGIMLSGVAHSFGLRQRLDMLAKRGVDAQNQGPAEIATYDRIRWENADVGDRLTKVRAECRMCDTLISGWSILILVNPCFLLVASSLSRVLKVEIALVVLIVAAYSQRRRTYDHWRTALANYKGLLDSGSDSDPIR